VAKIIFLGTNGWYDSETGNTISILIDAEQYGVVLDAGYGISKLIKCMKSDKPVYLFISHFHIDHIAGMHTLAMNSFSKGLFVLVQEGGTELLNRIMSAPYTIPLEELPFMSTILEVPQNAGRLPFKAEFLQLDHTGTTLGARLMIDGKVITYCPDTGYCSNAVKLAREADLLITECAFRPGESSSAWPHLNPETAARIAKEAKVKRLALTHFDAQRYDSLQHRQEAEIKAKLTFENSCITTDGMVIDL